MGGLRAFVRAHKRWAAIVLALALCLKLVLPAGYMISSQGMSFTVEICTDGLGPVVTKQITVPMEDGTGDASGKQAGNDCPFTALTMASLSGAEPALLAAALAFILALGFRPTRAVAAGRPVYLRPPLRGPPLTA
jgi:hypothetical protein